MSPFYLALCSGMVYSIQYRIPAVVHFNEYSIVDLVGRVHPASYIWPCGKCQHVTICTLYIAIRQKFCSGNISTKVLKYWKSNGKFQENTSHTLKESSSMGYHNPDSCPSTPPPPPPPPPIETMQGTYIYFLNFILSSQHFNFILQPFNFCLCVSKIHIICRGRNS